MARRSISLDDKIETAEAAVFAAKKRFDKALEEHEKLITKRKQLDDKRVLEAYHKSDKTADEIVAFLLEKGKEDTTTPLEQGTWLYRLQFLLKNNSEAFKPTGR